MKPSQEQRDELARRITSERKRQYVTKKAAYMAAGINSAPWDKAEDGLPIAERSLIAIVQLLWPRTGGDWEALLEPSTELDLEQRILDGPFAHEEKVYLLRLVREDRARTGNVS